MKCISLGSDFPSWAPGGGPAVASAKVSEVAASATVLRQRWQAWAWRCSASTLRGGRVSPSRCCVGTPIADDFTTPMGPWGPPRRRDIDSLPLPPRVATAIAHLFNRRIGCVLVSREPRGECHMAGDTQKKRAQCRRCGKKCFLYKTKHKTCCQVAGLMTPGPQGNARGLQGFRGLAASRGSGLRSTRPGAVPPKKRRRKRRRGGGRRGRERQSRSRTEQLSARFAQRSTFLSQANISKTLHQFKWRYALQFYSTAGSARCSRLNEVVARSPSLDVI